MAHTPGPWRFAQDGREPYWNVDMPMQDGSPGYGFANAMVYTTEEDARLIAAAPDLLAACHKLIDSDAAVEEDERKHQLLLAKLLAAKAIAKAEGVTMEDKHGPQN